MTAPMLSLSLTADEILAITQVLGLDRLPGVTELQEDVAEDPASAAAGRRSLCARGLAVLDDGDLQASEALSLIVEALAGAERRLTMIDPGILGSCVTLSVTTSTLVLHRRSAPGVHDVALLTRPAADDVAWTLLSRYDGRTGEDEDEEREPDADAAGVIAFLTLHTTDAADPWIKELAVWVGQDGSVARIDEDQHTVEMVTGAGTAMSKSLLLS